MGGGFVVREEAGEEWEPRIYGLSVEKRSIKVVRPLRDMGMKECAAWVWWNGLEVVGKENVVGAKQGIGGLTKGILFAERLSLLMPRDLIHYRLYCRFGKGLSFHGVDYCPDVRKVSTKGRSC